MDKIKEVESQLDYYVGIGVGTLPVSTLMELRDLLREGIEGIEYEERVRDYREEND